MTLRRFDFHAPGLEPHREAPAGFESSTAEIDVAIGAEHLRGQLVEVSPGAKSYPYHWEAGKEEWMLVLTGTPTIRTPEGEQELRTGDLACFPIGPEGAHQVLNHGTEPSRVIFLSDATTPNVVVYPDSGKVGIRTADLRLNFLEDGAVPYWTGE